MRYKEFERELNKLGFYVECEYRQLLFVYTLQGKLLLVIDDDIQYDLCFLEECEHLKPEVRSTFYDLTLEYAKTPIEERRTEEKKYNVIAYTELAGHRDKLFSTEKFYGRSGDYLIVSDKFSNGAPEQQWTLDQIKDWNLEGYERIEVK